jgi:hypothetical protein
MSTIQNIKNFIRHGKQAKFANAEPTTNVSPVHAHQQHGAAGGISEPIMDHHPLQGQGAGAKEANFSAAAVDNKNVAARAADAAAHATGKNQKKHQQNVKGDNKEDASVLERIVAEERASKGKLPKYPGLERWTLLEKMGDGAFSNVYRAKDTQGEYPEVAIKVVRKFEMNSNQVRALSLHICWPLLYIFGISSTQTTHGQTISPITVQQPILF